MLKPGSDLNPRPPFEPAGGASLSTSRRYRWLRWCLLAVVCAIPLSTLCMVLVVHNDIPWGDDLLLLRDTRFDQGLAWSRLFRFHNEHQVVFTKLAVFADYVWFRGRNIFTGAVAVLLALFIPLACCAAFRFLRKEPLRGERLAWLAGVLVTVYFNANLLWTLTDPILSQHLFAAAFAVVAAFSFSYVALDEAGTRKLRWYSFGVFFAASGLAALSSAAGLLVLPAALVVTLLFFTDWSLLLRITRWKLVGVLLAGLLGIAVTYLLSYRRVAGAGPDAAVSMDWAGLVEFSVLFIGGPFWRASTWPVDYHPPRALVLATCLAFCGLLCWLLAKLLRSREKVTRFDLFQAFMIVLVSLTALTGAWSRQYLGTAEALNRKYPPTSLLAWLAVVSLVVGHYPDRFFGRSWLWPLRPLLISALGVALIVPSQLVEFHAWRSWLDRLEESAATVAAGVYDQLQLRPLIPPLQRLRQRTLYIDSTVLFDLAINVLRPQGVYFLGRMPATPYPLKSSFQRGPNLPQQDNPVLRLTFVNQRAGFSGYLASGLSPAAEGLAALRSALVVDAKGYVVGYGHLARVAEPRGWFAAFRNPQNSPFVTVCAVDGSQLRQIARIELPAGPPDTTRMTMLDEVLNHRDYSLDQFNEISTPLTKPPVRLPADATLMLRGWAVDRNARRPAAGVEIEINGKVYPCSYGGERADVAAYFQQPAYRYSGFVLDLPATTVGKGKHDLRVRVVSADGKTFRRSVVFQFEVE